MKTKIRILFVNPFWHPYEGGIEKVISKISQELNKYNDIEKIGLLTSYNLYPNGSNYNLPDKEFDSCIEVHRLNFIPRGIPVSLGTSNGGLFAYNIKRVLDDFKPDVIQFMTDSWCIPNLLIYLLSNKTTKHFYSLSHHEIKNNIIYKLFYSPKILVNIYLTRQVNTVFVATELEKQLVHSTYKTPLDKIKVIPWGIDSHTKFLKKGNNRVTILCVSRLEKSKGQFHLLNIYLKLIKNIKQDTKIILAGADGGDKARIEEYIKVNKLQNNVILTGFITDRKLDNLYKKADLFVMLPIYESFGLVFVEALSRQTPVITYNTGTISNVLKKGAVLVNPGDDKELLKVLTDLINDSYKRKKLGKEGANYVNNTLSWKNTTTEFLSTYRRYLK